MRIKELHLRNIASIQKADIDFEHGLNDVVTGNPASMFLISGDTGSGKSIILDGISMALYKTTPRISGVSNMKDNKYVDAYGQKMNINSIQQYTRIGMNINEDCYSEVVFEGNDGIEYRAKLSLGLKVGRGSNAGKIAYKEACWEIQVGNGGWVSGVTEVENIISHAVGLSYEQFSRMAMLAQGQFAQFLTGNKEQRESILEKLTNTERFSKYGEAIGRVFSRFREKKMTTDRLVEESRKNTLEKSEIDRLTAEKLQLQESVKTMVEQIDQLSHKIKLLETIETQSATLVVLQSTLAELTKKQESDEYKAQQMLVADWDATIDQRNKLAEIDVNKEKKADAEVLLAKKQSQFAELTADLLHRKYSEGQIKEQIDELQAWISGQKKYEHIHKAVDVICLQIKQYTTSVKNLALKLEEEKRSRKASLELVEKRKNADAAVKKAQEALNVVQEEIESITQRRNLLKPEETNHSLQQANDRNAQLQTLKNLEIKRQATLVEIQNQQETIVVNNREMAELSVKEKELTKEHNQAEKYNKEAKLRYDTLMLSSDKKFQKLRARLVEEKAEICPLCGQHIEQLHSDFTDILAPLKVEMEKTQEVFDVVEKELGKVKSQISELTGSLKTANNNLAKLQRQLSKEAEDISNILKANDWITLDDGDTVAQLEKLISSVGDEIANLKKNQQQAETLQAEINVKLDERQKLEKAKSDVVKEFDIIAESVQKNDAELLTISREIENLKSTRDDLFDKINSAIVAVYPDWQATCDETKSNIDKMAKVYRDKCSLLESKQSQLMSDQTLFKNLSTSHSRILAICPDWECAPERKELTGCDINVAHTELLADVTTTMAIIIECKKKIDEHDAALTNYYQATAKTEVDLRGIQSQEKSLESARKALNDMTVALHENKLTSDIAKKSIAEANLELGVNDTNAAPDKQVILQQKAHLDAKRDDLNTQIGTIVQQLESNSSNNARLQKLIDEQQEVNKTYATWDLINKYFGGRRFRTLVQTHILRPLLNNANIYLSQISDRYMLTCSEENEQLSIFVQDRYNRNEIRTSTLLSGGERFIISLALSLALSSLNRPDMNINILFIDEGFGTLDERNLESVVSTLEKLQSIAGQSNRRVGIISHRSELCERIPVQIHVRRQGEGRSSVNVKNNI